MVISRRRVCELGVNREIVVIPVEIAVLYIVIIGHIGLDIKEVVAVVPDDVVDQENTVIVHVFESDSAPVVCSGIGHDSTVDHDR